MIMEFSFFIELLESKNKVIRLKDLNLQYKSILKLT